MKKVLIIVLAFVMTLSLAACSFSSSYSLTMNVETGDSIEVKLDTSDGLKMKWDSDKNTMAVSDDGELVLNMVFADEDYMKKYIEKTSGLIEIKDTGKNHGTRYTLFSAKEDDEDTYYVIGWIVGSDTGLIAEGTDSKKETLNAFKSLSFKIKDTDQDDEDYYLDDVIIENTDDNSDNSQDISAETESSDSGKEESSKNPEQSEQSAESEMPNTEQSESESESSTDTKEPVKETQNLSTNWKDFQIKINGKVITLPCSYKELKETTGYSMKSANEKSYLEAGYYTSVALLDDNENSVCNIDVLNTTDDDAAYSDCLVIEVSQYDSHLDDAPAIEFAGIQIGETTSKDELISKFGEPTDIYEYRIDEDDDKEWEKYESDTYTWSLDEDWTTLDFIEIQMNIHTGLIEEIRMDHSGAVE